MSEWNKINKAFEGADQIKALQELYMERGNVTGEQSHKWAIEQWEKHNQPPPLNERNEDDDI